MSTPDNATEKTLEPEVKHKLKVEQEPEDKHKLEVEHEPEAKHEAKLGEKRKAKGENNVKSNRRRSRKPDDFRDVDDLDTAQYYFEDGLRKVKPYFFEYKSYAKGRWLGRKLLEVFSTEFRDRSADYYKYAIEKGLITINGEPITVDTIINNSDIIGHKIHRHEPPCTNLPINIVHDDEGLFVVDKPGGIPVHPAGRYRHNTVIHVMRKERNIPKLYPANRLDMPTSGLMLIAKNPTRAKELEQEMSSGKIQKEYVCRVDGEFPEEEINCDAPIKCISHKMSVNYVHDDGKPSTTIFTRLGFNGKTSVVRCKPLTGRTHQIRVHLRYLGFPISNDPLYGFNTGWSPMLHPGEQMKEEEARLLVDKLFEFSPIEDWGTDGVQKTTAEGDRCNECSAVILPRDCQDHLCIYLHAWRYSGNNWDYETELPFWAKQDFDENKTPPQFVFNSKKAIV